MSDIKWTLNVFNSAPDKYGNCYWAFSMVHHLTGVTVQGTYSGGGSNARAIRLYWDMLGEWSETVHLMENELPIREFNRMTKEWAHAGCESDKLAEWAKKEFANQNVNV